MQKKHYRRISFFIAIMVLIGLIHYSGIATLITLENLQKYRKNFLVLVNKHYVLSVFLYILTYSFVIATSIPGATVLSLAGGFLFGFIATIYVVVGATIGAIVAFLLVRRTVGLFIQEKYEASLKTFNSYLQQYGIYFLLSIRLIPIIPFFLINILAGLTKVSLPVFALTTFFGIIPGTFMYVLTGRNVATIKSMRDILSWRIIIPLLLMAIIIIVAGIYRNKKLVAKKTDS